MDVPLTFEAGMIPAVTVAVSVWIDLFFHRKAKEITFKDAAVWSCVWITLALSFYAYLFLRHSPQQASLFLSGYVLEKALSIDNMMVFVAIFASFNIKGILQHRILYFGIIGALLFRALFVAAGTWIFGISHWVEAIFAAIVLWTGVKMFMGSEEGDDTEDYSDHWSVRLTNRIMPVTPRLIGHHFVVSRKHAEDVAHKEGFSLPKRAVMYATPMLLCLMCIEISDVIFSFDSVPAIIAVTKEPFLVYASVIFAILGLRNLYFMLPAAAKYLVHLEKAVALVLVFIAAKLAGSAFGLFTINHLISLAVVLGLIAGGVIISLIFPSKKEEERLV